MANKRKNRRAAKGEGCIRKRSDGRWEYIYTDTTGASKSAYGRSEAEVAEKKKAIQSALYEGTYVDPSSYTVSTWADYFFEELYNCQNVDTRAPVYSHIKIHIKPFFKSMKLQDVCKEDILRFHRHLMQKNLATHTIENIHSTLVQIFDSAIPKRIRINPAKGIRIEKGVGTEMLYFTEDEYLDFCKAVSNAGICTFFEAALFLLALWTGMREGELLGLVFDNIDFETGTIYVRQQLKKLRPIKGVKTLPNKRYFLREIDDDYYLALPKYVKDPSRTRFIHPGTKAVELLKEAKEKQIEARLRTGLGDAYNPDRFVFVSNSGRHLTPRSILTSFKKILVFIGGDTKMRIHDLRHTYVYNALLGGLTYDQISEDLGHQSVDFTKKKYGHFPKALHEDAAKMKDSFHEKMALRQAEREEKARQASQVT